MPRNGSGIYGPPAGTAAVPNTTIESADYNAVIADMAQALTDSINVQGTAPFQANQPMGGNKLTNMGAGAVAGDAANVGQIQSGIVAHAASVGGTADAITATFSPAFTAYSAKMRFRFTAGAANVTTAPTVNVDGLGAKTIKKLNGGALTIGDIAGSGHVCDCVYNGTDVILLNFAPVAVDREQTFTARQTFSKPVITTMTTLTDAATIAWDMNATSNDVRIVLTASRNLGLPTNINTGQKGLLIVQQDATGGWGLTPNAIFKSLGSFDLEKAPNAKSVFSYQVVEDHSAVKMVLLERIWSEGKSAIGFWKEYDLGLFVNVSNQVKTQVHGLGRHPSLVTLCCECIVAEYGYTPGQRVVVPGTQEGQTQGGVGLVTTTTNVLAVIGGNIWINRQSDSAIVYLSDNRWRLFLRVFE